MTGASPRGTFQHNLAVLGRGANGDRARIEELRLDLSALRAEIRPPH